MRGKITNLIHTDRIRKMQIKYRWADQTHGHLRVTLISNLREIFHSEIDTEVKDCKTNRVIPVVNRDTSVEIVDNFSQLEELWYVIGAISLGTMQTSAQHSAPSANKQDTGQVIVGQELDQEAQHHQDMVDNHQDMVDNHQVMVDDHHVVVDKYAMLNRATTSKQAMKMVMKD